MDIFFNGCCIGHYDSKHKDCGGCRIKKSCMHITHCHFEDVGIVMRKNYKDIKLIIKRFCNDKHKKDRSKK